MATASTRSAAASDVNGSARKGRDVGLVEGEVPRRLRAARESRGISVRDLARRLGLTPSAISQIETGRARPSVSTLYAIVSELGLSLDELFSAAVQDIATTPKATAEPIGPKPAAPMPAVGRSGIVQRAADRRTIELETGVSWDRLTADADPDVDFLFVNYPVGSATSGGGILMRHAGREYGLVLSGRLEVTVGFDAYVLEAGDSLSFPSTTPHRLANVGDEPVTGVWVVIGRRGGDVRGDGLVEQENDRLAEP